MSIMSRIARGGPVTAALVAGLLVGSAVVALGAIPGSNGVINGCYGRVTGLLRVIDVEVGQRCTRLEIPISWNQVGEQGPTGPQGQPGPPLSSMNDLQGLPCDWTGGEGTVDLRFDRSGTAQVECVNPAGPHMFIVWDESNVEVTSEEWVLMRYTWGFASDPSRTQPPNYLEAVLSGGFEVQMWIDGQEGTVEPIVVEEPEFCGMDVGGSMLCTPVTWVYFQYLSPPLGIGDHTFEYATTLHADFPDDGFGWSGMAGDTSTGSGTITVSQSEA